MKKLTPHQEQLKQAVLSLQPGDRLLIEGEGGSGKTTVVGIALQGLDHYKDLKIAVVAPTHNAKDNLLQNIPGAEPFTSIKFAGMGLSTDWLSGDLIPVGGRSAPYHQEWDYIIIDEVQMVSKTHLKHILNTESTLIMLGDSAQTPPVKEGVSPIWDDEFQSENDIQYRLLDGQYRQPPALYELSSASRGKKVFPEKDGEMNQVVESPEALKQKFLELAKTESDICYFSFTNAEVEDVTKRLRANSSLWVVGDVIRCKGKTYQVTEASHGFNLSFPEYKISIPYQVLTCQGEGTTLQVKAFAPATHTKLKKLNKAINDEVEKLFGENNIQKAKTVANKRELITPIEVEDARVGTVHKSIGRTISYVFLDTASLARYGTHQVLYVGLSRASKFMWTVRVPKKS